MGLWLCLGWWPGGRPSWSDIGWNLRQDTHSVRHIISVHTRMVSAIRMLNLFEHGKIFWYCFRYFSFASYHLKSKKTQPTGKKSVVTSPSVGRLLFPFNWRISVEFIQDGFEIVVLSFNKPEVHVLYFSLQVDIQSRVFCLWCKTPGYGQVTGPTTRMP